MILVVGATGELGTAIVEKLVAKGHKVRIFVRPTSSYEHLLGQNVELVYGDLRDARSVEIACQDVEAVVATANVVIPKGAYSFKEVEEQGYAALIQACQQNKVEQFVYVSVPVTPYDELIPTQHSKRFVESRLIESSIAYTIFRGSLFMEVWLALIGSSVPLRGLKISTIRRPFWFSKLFFRAVGQMIEKRGLALIPGDGKNRHAWIAIDEAATIIGNAVNHPQAKNKIFELGGSEALSFDEVLKIYSKVLGREVRALYTPVPVFRVMFQLFKPFSPAAANIFGLNMITGSSETTFDSTKLKPFIEGQFTTVEQFLQDKVKLNPS